MGNPRKALGIFLVVIGVVFLLANNNLLWFGWETLWPLVPFILGLAMMGMYKARRKPRQLFVGTLLLQWAFFFFLFSSALLPWTRLHVLWPMFPLMLGVSVILTGLVVQDHASPLMLGFTLVAFGVVAVLFTSGSVESRAAQPVVRLWPLLLVGVGTAIVWRANRDALVSMDTKKPSDSKPPPSDS